MTHASGAIRERDGDWGMHLDFVFQIPWKSLLSSRELTKNLAEAFKSLESLTAWLMKSSLRVNFRWRYRCCMNTNCSFVFPFSQPSDCPSTLGHASPDRRTVGYPRTWLSSRVGTTITDTVHDTDRILGQVSG